MAVLDHPLRFQVQGPIILPVPRNSMLHACSRPMTEFVNCPKVRESDSRFNSWAVLDHRSPRLSVEVGCLLSESTASGPLCQPDLDHRVAVTGHKGAEPVPIRLPAPICCPLHHPNLLRRQLVQLIHQRDHPAPGDAGGRKPLRSQASRSLGPSGVWTKRFTPTGFWPKFTSKIVL